jgi:hypothetical protein
VAGGLERHEPHPSELHVVAVGERCERIFGLCPSTQIDPGADPVAKLEVSGKEIGMEMRQENVPDAAANRLGVGHVLVDVALRVDDRGDACILIGDEVRRVGEAAELVLLQDHAPTIAASGARERAGVVWHTCDDRS